MFSIGATPPIYIHSKSAWEFSFLHIFSRIWGWGCLCACVLGPHPCHMEVPRLGVELELHLQTYSTATIMQDLSCTCTLYQSSWQCRFLNPLHEARDLICIFMDASQIVSANKQWESPHGVFWLWFPWWLVMLSIFSYALAFCISPLDNYLFSSFAHSRIRWFHLYKFISLGCLYMFVINSLLVISFANIFPHWVDCLFILSLCLSCVNALKFNYVSFVYFYLYFLCLGNRVKKLLFLSKVFCLVLTLEVWEYLVLLLGLLSILSLFLCVYLENTLVAFFYIYLFRFTRNTYCMDCLFSIVYSRLLNHRLIDHRFMGLFFPFLSCSIDVFFYFGARTMLLWLL